MKRLHVVVLGSLFALLTFSGCKKDDKPTAKECQVQQFETTRNFNNNGVYGPVPYLFSKTFDANGDVNTIDAYVYSLSPGLRIQAKFERKNQMVYALSSVNTDTAMVIWLNSAGRVIKAQEKKAFESVSSGNNNSYDFTYDASNKLKQYQVHVFTSSIPQTFTVDVVYDAAGNCTQFGNTSFTYDLTRTAKKQFYFDIESINYYWLGVKFLEYLNYFPEVTNPVNIRTHTKALAPPSYVLGEADLTDHQFDADGKLISYKVGTLPALPIYWSCGNNIKQ